MLQTDLQQRNMLFDADEIAQAFAHIEQMWPALTKDQKVDDGTLIGLPYPYVVPSVEPRDGFVFEEMYYWDSYFVMQGLLSSGKNELAEGMLENLLFLARRFHLIPNASRYYFTGRSQPPLLTSYIFDIYDANEKNIVWLQDRISVAEREYNTVWMGQLQPNHRNVYKGLSRYYDINVLDDLAEAESGWDMTTRFYGQCLSFIPIDLNSLLHKYELDFARAYTLFQDHDTADVWRAKAAKRAETINNELWDKEKGFYFDFDYQQGSHSDIWSLAGLYPLFCGVATPTQAERIVQHLNKFQYTGGLCTTSASADENAREIAHQWAYPNGWAPLQWIAITGLQKYGYNKEAEHIARTWLNGNLRYFQYFGVFREAYNVVEPLADPVHGVYPPQIGFGWTNAVFVDLARKFLTPEELLKV